MSQSPNLRHETANSRDFTHKKGLQQRHNWLGVSLSDGFDIPSGKRLQFAIENGDLEWIYPLKLGGSFHSYVKVYQAG